MSNPFQGKQVVLGIAPQASATTARSAAVDCADADHVRIMVPITSEANTNSTNVILDVQHSDANDTNYVSLGTTLVDNTAAIVAVRDVPMRGRKRWLKIVATPDTTTNGAVLVGGIIVSKRLSVSPNESTTSSVAVV